MTIRRKTLWLNIAGDYNEQDRRCRELIAEHEDESEMIRSAVVCMIVVLLCCGPSAQAMTTTLYDGSLNTLPGSQGWLYLTSPLFGSMANQSMQSGAVRLVTTAASSSDSAGYFNTLHPSSPVLDRNTGYTLSVEARINSETHSSTNRAGFSVIVLSSDKKGLEVALWNNEVWVQNDTPLFTHGEGFSFNTTAAFARYDISILGSAYILAVDGVQKLTGSIRDYTAFSGFPDVYETANFIFLGDNTSSAYASVDIRSISVTLHPTSSDDGDGGDDAGDDSSSGATGVPEPASLSALALITLLLSRRRSR